MKQTNNAIKFLMAQYRAIFKNANLKMFLAAATAAAAMAAGSAQAADKITTWDSLVTGTYDATNDGSDDNKIGITATASTTENKTGFAATITSGSQFIKGGAGANALTVAEGKPSSFIISGSDPSNTNLPTLKIGGAATDNDFVAITVDSVTNTKGTLEVEGKDAQKKSSLTAETITIGAAGTPATKAAVNVNAFGSLNATGSGENKGLIITEGAKITIADNASVTGAEIKMDSGSVVLSGSTANTKFGSNTSAVTITGGTVEAAATKSGSIIGSNIILSGGEIKATGGLTIKTAKEGAFTANGGTITNADGASLTFDSKANINKGAKLVNSGTLVFNAGGTISDEATITNDTNSQKTKVHVGEATLTLGSKTLQAFIKGDEIANVSNKKATIELNDTEKLNLETATIIGSNGTVSDKFKKQGTGSLTIKAGDAEFKGEDKITGQDGVTLSFKNLTVGKGTADDVSLIKGGISVSESLSTPDGKGLILDSGNALTLAGTSGAITAKSVTVGSSQADATLSVNKGNWSVPALTVTKGKVVVAKDSGLTVTGALTPATSTTLEITGGYLSTIGDGTIAFQGADENSVKLATGGTLKLDEADIIKDKKLDTAVYKKNAVSGDGSTIIVIDNKTALTNQEFKDFKDAVGTSFTGVYKMNVDVELPEGELTLTNIVDGLATDKYNQSTLNVADTETISKSYSVGNVHVKADKDLMFAVGGSLILNTADKDGNFVSKNSGTGTDVSSVVAGVQFADKGNTLTLVGSGNIGAISTTSDTSKGKLVIGLADETPVAGHATVVSGGIGDTTNKLGEVALNDGSSLTVKSGNVFADNLALGAGTSLDVNGDVSVDSAAVLGADIKVNNFSIKQTTSALPTDAVFAIDAGSMRVTDKLDLGKNNLVTVGTAATFDAEGAETAPGSSAQVFAGTLEIETGSVLFVDPSYKSAPSFVVGQTITDGTTTGNLAGSIAVGANSAVGFGFTETEFNDVMSKHLVDGKFVAADGYANAVVIGTPITIADGSYINVDKTLNKASGDGNTVHLGAGAALVVTKDALDPTNGAIKFAATSGSNKVNAEAGSTIVLEGGVTLADKDLTLFSGANTITSQATIAAAGGLIAGTLDTTGKLTLAANNEKLNAIRSVVSSPIVDLLVDYRDGDFHGNADAGLDFIESMLNKDNFVAIDAAAHAATYAGAQQAAVAAVGSMAEAVGGRVGSMGVEAATIAATGSQVTGGVWVSPMYKSVDADGFNAQGASYGSDIDLAGVAFGADTVEGNSRYGVVFNIGSGEAEGKGNGNGLKDDFDYYGIGLYSVRASNNFAVVADASYNVISHDVEGLGAKGSAETVALTAGLTGQYTMSSPMVDVTPHLGARFIRLDTDSYDLVAGGDVVAETDFDVQNVFSVPLGVTLSKAFEMGGWSLAPSADLSITFNTGDTDVESNTYFTGTKSYGFTTEVLDEVTYGVAVGLGAQYGAFGTNIALNYTGSENTDSFGVNAQARYMF